MIIYFVYWGFRARRLRRSFCAQITLLIIVWIRMEVGQIRATARVNCLCPVQDRNPNNQLSS